MLTAALVGNPNVGKTTLFNFLTGSNQYVGNWAGVTVEKKEGFLNKSVKIVDLPGIYAMDTYSNEEKVSKNFLLNDDVDVIVNIVDASNLDRNLYLTMQLKQFKKPIILVLNMIDVALKKGVTIDYKSLSKELNVTVIPIVASKHKDIDKIVDSLNNTTFSTAIDEKDYNFKSEKETYSYIESILNKCTDQSKEINKSTTERIDNILLNKILAYPIFIGIICLIFKITFSWVGQPLQDLLDGLVNDSLIPLLHSALASSSPWFSSLIVDGIVGGVGSVIVFLPIILTLFFCVSILEDSGYMARTAFLMDNIMRKMGLSGKAFIPVVISFGCSVPAIMASRTLESEKDRKLTALLVPLMSCNARLPIYALLAAAFFPKHQGLVIGSLYLLGIFIAFIIGLLFKSTIFKKDEEPLIIELPEYKLPELKSLLIHTWDKGKGFVKKAGTIIFSISVLIWLLSNFGFTGMVNIESSFLAGIGHILVPIFKPLGFGTWQNSVALLTGLGAKEVVVSTLGVLYGANLSELLPKLFTPVTAYAFLVFVLLYPPCISALGTMKKEYGSKMTVFTIVYQILLAWIVSFTIYRIGLLII
ncbi:ferrous iron transport protein B [Clostridium pasteurianum DSM 525 = ATCC 6013]|uniref:Ferrous iron transport protein B n=1 Tax=Clostridium pasteurianum DSM 525 = ATCC 6013 TaxID=1262449 RepID=A0A0H3J0U3_CLOPA|nr:ferrous iron transport protein B [Clostridium pasteurianum]AJA47466.1 ferrous iron transport protein B [Clostridium pasteurianum DSM 525 = ATCC 6013]AJA51454.1 ferrous iron transport protein B [Clostridium pasteurianum DSM 525 = ATCC 6013]AOZ74789.1 iron transporter FeoB [Clostridium pasteurianum DSM 525 = ATCC 6013]AOZ78585.1 iron transporter FeoB [Clostridium pasteurianum]ELP58801.1 ferrous iron transport protein B [Clostridium pasteurianum DSM 525 = ATCC 6013]